MPRNSNQGSAPIHAPRLRIGAVSRLTRIPVDTLRAWERRYGVVAPNRDLSAVRLYDQDDVERLTRIKRLVDSGHAIGSVANLPRADLERMLALHDSPEPASARAEAGPTQVVCYSESVPTMDVAKAATAGVTVLEQHGSWTAFETAVLERAPEAMVIEMAAVLPERVDEVLRLFWRSAVVRVIVCYGFSSAAAVRRLESEGVVAMQSPVRDSQILRELRRQASPTLAHGTATRRTAEPRLLDDDTLARIAKLSTSVDCECPHHLVGIIRTLNQFELYSATCEHRHADDAAVHAMLRASTAQARALMERALIEVAELEGLPMSEAAR